MEDKYGALIRPDIEVHPLGSGQLDGTTFAAKDNIDVGGYVSSAGNPDWLDTHFAAEYHAKVIIPLLWAGAKLTGKAHTDELMYSLNGENFHYGTPVNPRAPGRIPGGSSSGSAVAVAGGLTDFALGTDTGGSVRIPSSYCGIYGIRPTHGCVSTEGVIKLAPSFCTVGWMAKSADLLSTVGEVLLGPGDDEDQHLPSYQRCIVATDALALAMQSVQPQLLAALASVHGAFESVEYMPIADEGLDLWLWAFRTLQAREIWQTHGEWIETTKPSFGPGIAERFAWTKSITPQMANMANRIRTLAKRRLAELLGNDGLLVLPSAPGGAPVVNWRGSDLEDWRNRSLRLTCIAGLAGAPQVTVPWAKDDDLPVGLSFVGAPHDDVRLLRFLARLEKSEIALG